MCLCCLVALCIVCDLLRPIRAAAHFSSPVWRGELRRGIMQSRLTKPHPLLIALGHTHSPRRPSPEMGLYAHKTHTLITWLVRVVEAMGCGTWTLFSCRRQLSFSVKASRPSRLCLRGKGKIDLLPPCFQKFNTSTPRSPLLSSL